MKKISIKAVISTLLISAIFSWYGYTPKEIHAESTTETESPTSAPSVTVQKNSYDVGIGEKFNVNNIKLSVTANGKYTITFEDGTLEKVYTSLGNLSEKVVVTDTSNGLSTVVTVNIKVVDLSKPIIKGVKDLSTIKGVKINLLKGVTAKDNVDGVLTSQIKVSKVDFNKVGKQSVTYTVTDKAGNKATKTATLTVKSNEVACNKIMYVTASSLNVRKTPSGDSAKVTSVTYRSKVTVVATISNSTWVKIAINNGKTVGYVNGDYLSKTQPSKPVVPKSNNNNNSSNTNNNNNSSSKPKDKTKKPVKDLPYYDRPQYNPDDCPDGDGF